jgi:ADP-heptose:LPS heptosyltransferase
MKILVARFSSIGDIVLTSPVLRALATQYPGAEVHVATKACYTDLVRFSPHVAKVHGLQGNWTSFVAALRQERFDVLVDLHGSLRSWRLARALRVKRHCYAKRALKRWALVRFKLDLLRGEHVVSRYFQAVRCLDVVDDGEGLELHVPPNRAVDRATLPATHRNGYTVLAIGATHATKRLPVHKLVALALEVRGPIVLVGGDAEMEAARAVTAAVGDRAYDAVGRCDLLGSASLIRGAEAVIAHDSAAMHMASAFRRPLVSVWGGTVPALGMGPYPQGPGPTVRIAEVEGLDCRPCCKIGRPVCPRGHFACMERQDVVQIARFAREVAAAASPWAEQPHSEERTALEAASQELSF